MPLCIGQILKQVLWKTMQSMQASYYRPHPVPFLYTLMSTSPFCKVHYSEKRLTKCRHDQKAQKSNGLLYLQGVFISVTAFLAKDALRHLSN